MNRAINDADLKAVNVFTAGFGVICLVGIATTIICGVLGGVF